MRKASSSHSPEAHESEHESVLPEVAEKAQEFIENALEGSDDHVIHCPKCYGAQQSEKYMKTAAVFSIGAFILSLVSIALPFLHASDVSQEQWEKLLTVLSGIQASSSSVSSVSSVPAAVKQTSSRAAQAATARSSASKASTASSEASSAGGAADGTGGSSAPGGSTP